MHIQGINILGSSITQVEPICQFWGDFKELPSAWYLQTLVVFSSCRQIEGGQIPTPERKDKFPASIGHSETTGIESLKFSHLILIVGLHKCLHTYWTATLNLRSKKHQHSSEKYNRIQSPHKVTLTMSRIHSEIMQHVKNQENMTHSREKIQSTKEKKG